MSVVEIEVPIKGNKEDIDKFLLNNGFEEFYKVLTISSYYLLESDKDMNHSTLKERCKRIRYVEPLTKFKNQYQDYKEWIKDYKLDNCIEEEKRLLEDGYIKIYTDCKTDYVYKNITECDMYFQIQDIMDDCLMIAYDNKNYRDLEEKKQRKRLINDVLKHGIEIVDEKNIDRFKLVGKLLTIDEIVNIMNNAVCNLN